IPGASSDHDIHTGCHAVFAGFYHGSLIRTTRDLALRPAYAAPDDTSSADSEEDRRRQRRREAQIRSGSRAARGQTPDHGPARVRRWRDPGGPYPETVRPPRARGHASKASATSHGATDSVIRTAAAAAAAAT